MAVIKISVPEGTPDEGIVDIIREVAERGDITETLKVEDGDYIDTKYGTVDWELGRYENL